MSDEVSDFICLDMMNNLMNDKPKIITRYDMMSHFKGPGHFPIDISIPDAVMSRLRCPIYADNDRRPDILFNNYLCECGRLFIFKAPFQKAPDGRSIINSSYIRGICPCDNCRHFKNGCRIS